MQDSLYSQFHHLLTSKAKKKLKSHVHLFLKKKKSSLLKPHVYTKSHKDKQYRVLSLATCLLVQRL